MHFGEMKFKQRGREEQAEPDGTMVSEWEPWLIGFSFFFSFPFHFTVGMWTYHLSHYQHRNKRLFAPSKPFTTFGNLKQFSEQPTLATIRKLLTFWVSPNKRRTTSTESLLLLCIWVKWNSSREVVKNKLSKMAQLYVQQVSFFNTLCSASLCSAPICFAMTYSSYIFCKVLK